MPRSASLIAEALVFIIIAVAAAAAYHVLQRGTSTPNGFECPGGTRFSVGPGKMVLEYSYTDTLCGYHDVNVSMPVTAEPATLCSGGSQGLIMPFNPSGEPIIRPSGEAYISTPMGIRPAYVYLKDGMVVASACMHIVVPGHVRMYIDKDTGILLRAQVLIDYNGTTYTVRDIQLRSYTLQSGGSLYRPGLLLGAAYALTAGVAGAAIAFAAKRLIDAL